MALLLRFLTGGPVAILLAGVALVLPGTAFSGPTFLLGVADPCPSCDTVTFDGSRITQGTDVTTQFVAEGVTFRNTHYDDGSLGQSSAPGFSGGSLVNASGDDIFIIFGEPRKFAAFAYADVGWDPCCGSRTLSAYLGSQLVASTDLPLRPARFLTVAATYPAAAAADAVYSHAADKVAADKSAIQTQTAKVTADISAIPTQTAKVTADQASVNAAQAKVNAAVDEYILDQVKWATCTSYYLVCDAIYIPILIADLVTLSNASKQLEAAAAQLQTDQAQLEAAAAQLGRDQAQLAVLQTQYQRDQTALADALFWKTLYDGTYEQALADDPGPGFIGFSGAFFDTLVLSSLGSLGYFPVTTVIDTLESVPEPSTVTLVGVALATLAYLRRTRRRLTVVG